MGFREFHFASSNQRPFAITIKLWKR